MIGKLVKFAPLMAAALWANIHAAEVKAPKAAPAKEKKFLMGYYPNWSHYAGYTAEKIPYDYLTHILYAFYITDNAGNLTNSDPLDGPNMKDVIRLGHEKGVKILLSIGGASQSEGFSHLTKSQAARSNFIKNCLRLADEYKLDGIDLDWEFPAEGDGPNQLALHRELRAALDKQPRKILFTAAVAATDWFGKWSLDESFHLLDYLNVMSYDYMGLWEKVVIPNSGMDLSRTSLEYYESRGIPRSKLVIGAAFYGKSFDGGTGMGSTYEGKGSGTDGIWQWKDLLVQLKSTPYKLFWDEKTQSEYAIGNEEIIVFNGIPSTRVRGEFIRNSDYAGVMLWDLLSDTQDTKTSLLVALHRGLRGTNRMAMQVPPAGPPALVPAASAP
jgi:chitinase